LLKFLAKNSYQTFFSRSWATEKSARQVTFLAAQPKKAAPPNRRKNAGKKKPPQTAA